MILHFHTSGGEPVDLDCEATSGGLRVGSEEVPVIADGESSGCLVRDGRVIPFAVHREGSRWIVWMRGETYVIESGDAAVAETAVSSKSGGEVVASMPGTVFKLLVAVGDVVSERQPVLIMESMKMELSLAAPAAGRVARTPVQPGQMVDIGTVLMVLDPLEET